MDQTLATPDSDAAPEPPAAGRPVERPVGPEKDWIETRLRGLWEAVLDEPVPPELLALLESPPGTPPHK
ncbi:hypothetical protein STAQ_31400 [Allostella sp. ATCC 35155]|nr:hypothetical protein STAQ_31400 [Stella sp. ATCC 35155]